MSAAAQQSNETRDLSVKPEPAAAVQGWAPVSLAGGAAVRQGSWMVAQAEGGAAKKASVAAQAGGVTAEKPVSEAAAGHGESYEMPEELPNVATWIESVVRKEKTEKHTELFHIGPVPIPIDPLFSIFYAFLIVWVIRKAMRNANVEKPGKLQNAVEALMGGLRHFFVEILGQGNEKYVPYVGSLWLFIWINNLAGLIPGLKAPTSSFKITIALGLCTFIYVQYNAIKEGGIGGWLHHLLGSPTDAITWCLSPLFFFLEVMGELVKPISLSLRLFGNIFGEDKLLASFLGMGMMIVAGIMHTAHPPVGVPLHVIFFPLVVLTSTIQATVFSLLASIYIVLLLPHKHEHGHDGHAAAGPEAGHGSDSVAAAGQV